MAVALLQEGINASSHLGFDFSIAIDVESGRFLEILLLGEAETEHILLFASNGEEVFLVVMNHNVDLLKVIVSQRVNFEHCIALYSR